MFKGLLEDLKGEIFGAFKLGGDKRYVQAAQRQVEGSKKGSWIEMNRMKDRAPAGRYQNSLGYNMNYDGAGTAAENDTTARHYGQKPPTMPADGRARMWGQGHDRALHMKDWMTKGACCSGRHESHKKGGSCGKGCDGKCGGKKHATRRHRDGSVSSDEDSSESDESESESEDDDVLSTFIKKIGRGSGMDSSKKSGKGKSK